MTNELREVVVTSSYGVGMVDQPVVECIELPGEFAEWMQAEADRFGMEFEDLWDYFVVFGVPRHLRRDQ